MLVFNNFFLHPGSRVMFKIACTTLPTQSESEVRPSNLDPKMDQLAILDRGIQI